MNSLYAYSTLIESFCNSEITFVNLYWYKKMFRNELSNLEGLSLHLIELVLMWCNKKYFTRPQSEIFQLT